MKPVVAPGINDVVHLRALKQSMTPPLSFDRQRRLERAIEVDVQLNVVEKEGKLRKEGTYA
jgi:hypothetical protein